MTPLELLTTDPWAQRLLASSIPARLAYLALDGTPRVIPTGFHFDGAHIVVATAEGAPKIAAIEANPHVALTIDTDSFPPNVLHIRGTATVSIVDGACAEYLTASRKLVPVEQWGAFQAQVNALYDRMARIEITPTWANVLDFETRTPKAVMALAAKKGFTHVDGPHPAGNEDGIDR